MAIEQASMRVVRKPWGSTDLLPWSNIQDDNGPIGELWCQRAGLHATEPALLLKLIFTTQPLSIQVHPDDAFARSIGLAHGKTEAWYILSAAADARVALGLTRHLDAMQLRASIEEGSISQLVRWHSVQKDDVILVPAGTIHSIGPGIVLAEIQQRNDSTFRLFDYGRRRGLDVDDAVAAYRQEDPSPPPIAGSLSDARTLLIANPYFILERIDLTANACWDLKVDGETWLLVLDGHALIGPMSAGIGKAFYLDTGTARIEVGPNGLTTLLAYSGTRPAKDLLTQLDRTSANTPSSDFPRPSIFPRTASQKMEARR